MADSITLSKDTYADLLTELQRYAYLIGCVRATSLKMDGTSFYYIPHNALGRGGSVADVIDRRRTIHVAEGT